MLLEEIPELEAHKSGRDILLAFAIDVAQFFHKLLQIILKP